jgi:hypothetical protein
MTCKFFNEISDEWVNEKSVCINPNEMDLEIMIETMIRSHFEHGPQHFTPQEFALFLRWKGLARNIDDFLEQNSADDVTNATHSLFICDLRNCTFQKTQDISFRNEILREINILFHNLQCMHRVGPAVASACLALCFPELCVTADYIVPALLHNKHDALENINPLYTNHRARQILRQALIMPVQHSLSAYRARNIATNNYTNYIQELWNIKRLFGLRNNVRKIEAAIWSFGICYVKRGRDNNESPNERRPLKFNLDPNPPRGGPFSKALFNPNAYCLN